MKIPFLFLELYATIIFIFFLGCCTVYTFP